MSCLLLFRYIPLGGRRTQLWSMWIIFTFIGLWHNLWCVLHPLARSRPCVSLQVELVCLGLD